MDNKVTNAEHGSPTLKLIDDYAAAAVNFYQLSDFAPDEVRKPVWEKMVAARNLVEVALAPQTEPVAVVDSELPGGIGWTETGRDLVDGQELFVAAPAPQDYRRVAACLKACEGLSTEVLEKATLQGDGLIAPDFLTDLARSRAKHPGIKRMFDGLLGEVHELKRAYQGDGDIRAEAFDVAVCAYRIATEGDEGGNEKLEHVPDWMAWGTAPAAQPIDCPGLTDAEIDKVTFEQGLVWAGIGYGPFRKHARAMRVAAPASQPNEADELLRNLGLEPEQYRTDGGYINHLKVKASIRNPEDYPQQGTSVGSVEVIEHSDGIRRSYAHTNLPAGTHAIYTATPAAQPVQEPDWSNSETGLVECWKNRLHPMPDRLRMADGAVAFRDKTIANLRSQLKAALMQSVPVQPDYFMHVDDDETWRECPDDCDVLESAGGAELKVGDEYECEVAWKGRQRFRVTKVPDGVDDDYKVELMHSSRTLYLAAPAAKPVPEGEVSGKEL